MHLEDHVALMTSEHHGTKLALLYTLSADWIQVFDYDDRDDLTDAMLDAADWFGFQASVFDSLHGFYRSSISNLRRES